MLSVTEAEQVEQLLAPLVARAFPGAAVAGLKRLTGGASLQTWAFDAVGGEESRPLILRRLPPGQPPLMNSVTLATEAAVIREAGAAGVPVAAVRGELDQADGQGFVADFIAGETVPRPILRDAAYAPLRADMARSCGEILARIHSLDPERLPLLALLAAKEQLDTMEASYRSRPMRSPVFEYGFRWLREHMPPPVAPVVVHGDFRLGNLLVGPDAIRAVLDWELVHLGDPAEDLGWVTVNSWRFGTIDKPVAGMGAVEEMLDGYAAQSGVRIDAERVRYWRALGSLRWGIGCGEMANGFAEGIDLSVERGMIGRRVSENEVDLLDIIAARAA